MAQLKTLGTTMRGSLEMRAAVGQAPHIVQIRAYANVPTKAAFARALIAYGLGSGDESRTVRALTGYVFEPKFNPDLESGVVYIRGLNDHPTDPYIALTPKEN